MNSRVFADQGETLLGFLGRVSLLLQFLLSRKGRQPLLRYGFFLCHAAQEKLRTRRRERSLNCRGLTKGWFPKGWFSKRVVLADVPPGRKPERGYIRMFPHNENRNEGTFACSPRNENRNEGIVAKTALLGNRPIISQ